MKKAIAVAGITVGILGAGGAAFAATAGGPAITSPPGKVGPYYSQGAAVNLCISKTNEGVAYVEEHTDVLGNCAAGYVQLTIAADPGALAPAPLPTGTPSS